MKRVRVEASLNSYHNTINLYGVMARGYDELYRDEQYSKYDYVFSKGLVPKGVVIDIGCGTGLLYEYIVSNGYEFDKYVCVEPCFSMLAIASKKLHQDPRTILVMGLGELNGIRKSIADCVYSFTVWDNVLLNYRKIFLEEIIKLIKYGGCAVLSFIRYNWEDKLRYIKIVVGSKYCTKFLGCNRYDCFIAIWKQSRIRTNT